MTKIYWLMAAAMLAVAGSFAIVGGVAQGQDGTPTATTETPATGTPSTSTPAAGSPTAPAATSTPGAGSPTPGAATSPSAPISAPATGTGTTADGDGLGLLWLVAVAPVAFVGTCFIASRLRRA